jgi:hypothetical protein
MDLERDYLKPVLFVHTKFSGDIMDFFNITTQEILERISRHCPEALSVYLQCINRANSEGSIFFSKGMVEIDMSEEWNPFCRNIKKLARENLLEWHPIDKGINVILATINDE